MKGITTDLVAATVAFFLGSIILKSWEAALLCGLFALATLGSLMLYEKREGNNNGRD